jgi:hypothetical protein
MTMLASQPRIPPITIHKIKFIIHLLLSTRVDINIMPARRRLAAGISSCYRTPAKYDVGKDEDRIIKNA